MFTDIFIVNNELFFKDNHGGKFVIELDMVSSDEIHGSLMKWSESSGWLHICNTTEETNELVVERLKEYASHFVANESDYDEWEWDSDDDNEDDVWADSEDNDEYDDDDEVPF